MTRPDSLRQKATAIHEAGHAVVAISHELPITSLTIQPGEEYRGRVVYPGVPDYVSDEGHPEFSYDKERNYMEAHALSSFAGSIAEFEYYRTIGKPKPEQWMGDNSGAQEDRNQAYEWVTRLIASEEELQPYTDWLFVRAKTRVTLYWEPIQAVQEALLQQTTLTGENVKNVIRQAISLIS